MNSKGMFLLALAALLLLLCGCGAGRQDAAPPETESREPEPTPALATEEKEENSMELKLQIGDTPVAVTWEENESVDALRKLAAEAPLTVSLSMYGGFEQVGSLGQSLPRSDVQTTTSAGDIVLYAGNQIVIFYGANTWAYTRLGHVSDRDAAGMEALLSQGDISITLSLEK